MTERRGKYNARKIKIDGICLDSHAEGRRYSELLLLQQAGQISGLEVHPRFELLPPFSHREGKERGVYYEADFRYRDLVLGETIVEDVKGVETAVFKLKRKLLLWRYPSMIFKVVKA